MIYLTCINLRLLEKLTQDLIKNIIQTVNQSPLGFSLSPIEERMTHAEADLDTLGRWRLVDGRGSSGEVRPAQVEAASLSLGEPSLIA